MLSFNTRRDYRTGGLCSCFSAQLFYFSYAQKGRLGFKSKKHTLDHRKVLGEHNISLGTAQVVVLLQKLILESPVVFNIVLITYTHHSVKENVAIYQSNLLGNYFHWVIHN